MKWMPAESYREFVASTRDHTMTVLHDDGLYRHIRFARLGSSIYRFDLVTWPGHLSITGDLESYTFARMPDMFGFFASTPGHINPGYWGEKIVAGSVVMKHSPAKFTQCVVDHFWERRHEFEGDCDELFYAIRRDVLEYAEGDYEARAAVDRFEYVTPSGRRFEFYDTREWNFTDYSVHYLRSLHAIVWGINEYRKASAALEVAA